MCGRIFVKTSAADLVRKFGFADARNTLSFDNRLPTFNGAPRQELPIIIREPDHPGGMFVVARRGLNSRWVKEANPKFQFAVELMTLWPISTRVNKHENNDADLLTPISE